MVERVSGESLAAFTQARIFGPLGMTDTGFRTDQGPAQPGDATGYDLSPSFTFVRASWPWDNEGAGNLHTNVLDLLRWAGNFASGAVGGPAFLKAQLVAGPRSVGPDGSGLSDLRYAAGIGLETYASSPMISHTGALPGFRAQIIIEPASRHAVALTCNSVLVADPLSAAPRALNAWFGT